jgi:hypothetical protein
MKYKTVVIKERFGYYKYAVKYKSHWYTPWRFIRRHGERYLIMTWDTLPGANAYINQEIKNGRKNTLPFWRRSYKCLFN